MLFLNCSLIFKYYAKKFQSRYRVKMSYCSTVFNKKILLQKRKFFSWFPYILHPPKLTVNCTSRQCIPSMSSVFAINREWNFLLEFIMMPIYWWCTFSSYPWYGEENLPLFAIYQMIRFGMVSETRIEWLRRLQKSMKLN